MMIKRLTRIFIFACVLLGSTSSAIARPDVLLNARYGGVQKLFPSDSQGYAGFGSTVILSQDGQILVVSSPSHDVGNNSNQGQVYVFQRVGNAWQEMQKLAPSDGAASDHFGTALAISNGPTYKILIGAPGKDGVGIYQSNMGAAYIFTRNGSTWSQEAKLEPIVDDYYLVDNSRGASVAISGDGLTAFVGAPGVDVGGTTTPEGVVYVFKRAGSAWNQVQRIEGSVNENNLGMRVHLSDGEKFLLVTSSFNQIINGGHRVVHIYQQTAGSWVKIFDLIPSDGEEFSKFGAAIATANGGNLVMIGAPDQSGAQGAEDGKAYIFSKSSSGWVESGSILHPPGIYNYFGESIALAPDGTQAVIGAWLNGSGAVYWCEQTGSGWLVRQRLTTTGSQEQLGYSVAFRGGTIVAGAKLASTDLAGWAGAAYTFRPVQVVFLPTVIR